MVDAPTRAATPWMKATAGFVPAGRARGGAAAAADDQARVAGQRRRVPGLERERLTVERRRAGRAERGRAVVPEGDGRRADACRDAVDEGDRRVRAGRAGEARVD